MRSRALYGIAIAGLLYVAGSTGCTVDGLLQAAFGTGYKTVDGEWAFVTWDEGRGRTVHKLGADAKTFRVVKVNEYAKDKNRVYYHDRALEGVDPPTFQLLKEPHYVKDKDHVFATNGWECLPV